MEVTMIANTILIENLVEVAMMRYSDFPKPESIESVHMFRTMTALQLYISCDNGDVIQIIYVNGRRAIYASLVGMHRSNDASIPVCNDKCAREELINELVQTSMYPTILSDRLYPGPLTDYPFLHRGHVVYNLKCANMNIEMIKDSFRQLVEDVLRKHKDGVLLDIANVRVDHLPKEIKEEWVLC